MKRFVCVLLLVANAAMAQEKEIPTTGDCVYEEGPMKGRRVTDMVPMRNRVCATALAYLRAEPAEIAPVCPWGRVRVPINVADAWTSCLVNCASDPASGITENDCRPVNKDTPPFTPAATREATKKK